MGCAERRVEDAISVGAEYAATAHRFVGDVVPCLPSGLRHGGDVLASWLSRLLGRTAAAPVRARRAPEAKTSPAGSSRPSNPPRVNAYQAVSVLACPHACAAACQVQGQRFLARQAPQLPLSDCTRPSTCRCRYQKFVDRRSLQQRSPYNNLMALSYASHEKRRNRGRRAGDR